MTNPIGDMLGLPPEEAWYTLDERLYHYLPRNDAGHTTEALFLMYPSTIDVHSRPVADLQKQLAGALTGNRTRNGINQQRAEEIIQAARGRMVRVTKPTIMVGGELIDLPAA